MKWRYSLLIALMLPTFKVAAQQDQQNKKMTFSYVEQMPEVGYDWNKYVSDNLHYPDSARELGVQGRVVVKFIVNEDGTISDATIIRGIGGGCDEEVLRLMKNVPRWKPARQSGKAVSVYYTLPIVFKLEESVPDQNKR